MPRRSENAPMSQPSPWFTAVASYLASRAEITGAAAGRTPFETTVSIVPARNALTPDNQLQGNIDGLHLFRGNAPGPEIDAGAQIPCRIEDHETAFGGAMVKTAMASLPTLSAVTPVKPKAAKKPRKPAGTASRTCATGRMHPPRCPDGARARPRRRSWRGWSAEENRPGSAGNPRQDGTICAVTTRARMAPSTLSFGRSRAPVTRGRVARHADPSPIQGGLMPCVKWCAFFCQ